MEKTKKYKNSEIIMLIFCSAGCLLMTAPLFIDNGGDFFLAAIALNGIGIMAFLYGQK